MREARATAGPLSGVDAFADCCPWVADAHLAEDPQQVVAALCDVYRLLVSRGWVPPEGASTVLRLHAVSVDVALSQLLDPAGSA